MTNTTSPPSDHTIRAGIDLDVEGRPQHFALQLGGETVTLAPGKSWTRVDEFKWVTRGLIEAPQSFHVEPDGTVDINGERIGLGDPDAVLRLEQEINKHHVPAARREPRPAATDGAGGAGRPISRTPHFRVKLDHFGHLAIECVRGAERLETGVKGLLSLVHSGLLLAPQQFHVDPLHRGVELDGAWFEASEAGARQLEEALNARYVPKVTAEADSAIEIRENSAAATGFDVQFATAHSGARIEVKGHLSQEKLDWLQDQAKCDLLRPGIILRLSPPKLLFRRRRSDGGEEHIPELDDLEYRHVSAQQLQAAFNHPAIRAGGTVRAVAPAAAAPAGWVALRVRRHPQSKSLLWLEAVPAGGGPVEGRALTHHNVAELQASGCFQAHLDVTVSLDNTTLGILDLNTREERRLTLDPHGDPAIWDQASGWLSGALKPIAPRAAPPDPDEQAVPAADGAEGSTRPPMASVTPPVEPPRDAPPPLPLPRAKAVARAVPASPPAVVVPPPVPPPLTAVASAPLPDSPWLAVFGKVTDAGAVNAALLPALAARLNLPIQDVRLSVPRVFTDRRFEVVSFSHEEIGSILELRGDDFHGFYLAHITPERLVFVYACLGRHLEWGPGRCVVQSAHTVEPAEFPASALLGLARDDEGQFVFVVTPAYREWIRPTERIYREAQARFVSPSEYAAQAAEFELIWPGR